MTMPLISDLFRRDWKFYVGPFAVAYIATAICYSYFFSNIGFTNHTLPNIWVYGYPSFKTKFEGRWFADILIQLTGGSGVPNFQIAIASAIQIVNAFIFCAIFRESNRAVVYMTALLIALHPTFLDYYSFAIDHISFAMGDQLALLGILAMQRGSTLRTRWVVPTICFILSIATYQPKIALIAFMLVARCLWNENEPGRRESDVARIGQSIAIFVLSVALYYVTVRMLVRFAVEDTNSVRQHINSIQEIFSQFLYSYQAVLSYFSVRVDYLPRALVWLPGFSIVMGLAVLLIARWRRGIEAFAIGLLLVLVIPPSLQLSYIINDQTFLNTGRILSAHAYLLCFAFIGAFASINLRKVTLALQGGLIYFFAVVAAQESNMAAVKNVFDIAKLNRIADRIETTVPGLDDRIRSLIVVGELKFQPEGRLKQFSNSLYGSESRGEPFMPYRQVDIMNFFLGRKIFQYPTADQVADAVSLLAHHKPWPSPDAVFTQGDSVIVMLSEYRSGSTTMAR